MSLEIADQTEILYLKLVNYILQLSFIPFKLKTIIKRLQRVLKNLLQHHLLEIWNDMKSALWCGYQNFFHDFFCCLKENKTVFFVLNLIKFMFNYLLCLL